MTTTGHAPSYLSNHKFKMYIQPNIIHSLHKPCKLISSFQESERFGTVVTYDSHLGGTQIMAQIVPQKTDHDRILPPLFLLILF
jgi:hypothetical protein